MPQLEQSLGKYSLVAASDHEAEIDIEKPGSNVHEKRRKLLFRLTSTHLISLVCLALVVTGGLLLWSHGSISNLQAAFSPPASLCKNPSTRREWRALSHSQKAEYIQAVQCLTSTKSIMGLNQTVHDDFSWVHSHVGNNCEANLRLIKTVKMLIRGSFLQAHDSAAFIAWHRYFIHVYEQTLRHHCGYTGFLTYWDWGLDWEDIRKSPIWDSKTGFGGDGNPSKGKPILHGHCIEDGPFAELQVLYLGQKYYPHCLSRGFKSSQGLKNLSSKFAPEALDKITKSQTNETFNLALENGPHNAIPRSIRGDFALFSAPNDPVFYLHHTQLDRLWWRWQRADPKQRLTEYSGIAAHNSTRRASLEDRIAMGDLAREVQVSEIMDTESGLLCYRY